MFKFFGFLLLVMGTGGFSYCICRELKQRLIQLKELKYMYELIQNEIRYTSLPIPLVFENVSDKVKAPFRDVLTNISRRLRAECGGMLSEVWEQEVKKHIKEIAFTRGQKESLLRFHESVGMMDGKGQAMALQIKIEEVEKWIKEQEKECGEKYRVIMSFGIAAGIMLGILLI